jgi:hypothetical protein
MVSFGVWFSENGQRRFDNYKMNFSLMELEPHGIITPKHIFHILGVAIRGLHVQSHILEHLLFIS